jgi:hypothetical protein
MKARLSLLALALLLAACGENPPAQVERSHGQLVDVVRSAWDRQNADHHWKWRIHRARRHHSDGRQYRRSRSNQCLVLGKSDVPAGARAWGCPAVIRAWSDSSASLP